MRRAVLAAIIAAASTVAVALPASAWDVIGVTQVNGRADSDRIDVDARGRFHRVTVCAYGAPVRIDALDIEFGNGRHQDVDLRAVLEPGECSRAIELRGRGRHIESVALAFGRLDPRRRASDGWRDDDHYGWRDDRDHGWRDERDWRRRHRTPIVRILAE